MAIFDWLRNSSPRRNPPTPTSTDSNGQVRESDSPQIELTDEFKEALSALEGSLSPLFITGNAGTGKSTLLEHFRRTTKKNVVAVAPTGMAALNVRGVTIHSFFKLPPKLLQEEDIRINHQNVDMFKKIDMIVIDEVSMVRADLLDAIDTSLRLHRANRSAFGGVQIAMFGDICQLPPVVKGSELAEYFSTDFQTPFFFSAKALRRTGLHVIELKRVFRQTDPEFVEVLNRIRRADASIDDMIAINERCEESKPNSALDPEIILTTTNKAAEEINRDRLAELPPPEFRSEAVVVGKFNKDAYPTSEHLVLKKGAKIMLIRNNGVKWVNGTLGTVTGWDDHSIAVSLPTGNYSVGPEKWEVIEYRYDKKNKRIEENVVGSFQQFPVKLAWAITIHKSQGQTFEKVVIDMNKGAFAHGQLYVALSRCKSLPGIRMMTPVALTDLCFDERVAGFIERSEDGYINLDPGHQPLLGRQAAPAVVAQTTQSRPSAATVGFRGAVGEAMRNGITVTISYSAFNGDVTRRTISPKTWEDDDKFVAFCHLRSDERHFRVSRILSLEAGELKDS